MLLNDFFFIRTIENDEKSLKVSLQINKTHKIFAGHFPAVPVVPGVCMMQMMKEIMEQQKKCKLMLTAADNMKFLAVINPTEHSEIEADIQYENGSDGVKISATLFSGSTTFFKVKAILQAE